MYSAISQNKTRTWMLMIIMGSFTLLLATILLLASGLESGPAFLLGGGFTALYALISYYFSDKIALMTSGAKPITKTDAPELYRIVENLCIANGQPMPAIYVMQDDSPNAFATGRDPEHASIAFTTGILRILDKQELEGVAAHELSHVKNYDIRVMTIVVVLVGAVMLISDILLRASFHGDRKQAGLPLILIGLALAILSPILAQIIQLAISRQREYLADASGALLTRYPEGLASALKKISAQGKPLDRANHATAHLFISSPFGERVDKKRNWFQGLFATHPPVEERISRLLSMGK
jgi:heat shock protein HtpX